MFSIWTPHIEELLQRRTKDTKCSETYLLLEVFVVIKFGIKVLYLEEGVGFPFAKLLRNFCKRKRNFFVSLRYIFTRKNNTLRIHSQTLFRTKLRYSALALFCFAQFSHQFQIFLIGYLWDCTVWHKIAMLSKGNWLLA